MPILEWLGKNEAVKSADKVPYKLLKVNEELSYGDKTENMIIKGDNLEALKALLPYYKGQVKCIYIDPPFNTKSRINADGKEIGYDDNLEHSIWLSMMYTRVNLLHELLAFEGQIFVHLDDNESDYMKVILDEIFGRQNFINRITIDARSPSAFSTVNPGVFKASEYILWYAKDKKRWESKSLRIKRKVSTDYNKFIKNKDLDFSKWEFIPVNLAFLLELNADKIEDLNSFILNVYSCINDRQAISDFIKDNFKYNIYFDIKKVSTYLYGKRNLEYAEFNRIVFPYLLEKISYNYNEKHKEDFILKNADRICRDTEISDTGAGEETVALKYKSIEEPEKIFIHQRKNYENVYIKNGKQISFYSKNVQIIDGELCATELLTNIWSDISWEGIAKEGGVTFKKGKKPEKLIRRILLLATNKNDLVLDSFLGSGTTCAVAHKMQRRYIGIEECNHIYTHVVKRLNNVVNGDNTGISTIEEWQGGGGYTFYKLGETIFDENGNINKQVDFKTLAGHVWFSETKTPLTNYEKSPLLGIHNGIAYYLLFNGILGDKKPDGGNVLTQKVLDSLPKFDGKKIIYGEASRMSLDKLKANNIVFKQTPYEIKAR